MKKQILFLLIICCLSLVFCCHHDNKKRNSLTPAFKQVLDDYISNNPTDSIYSVGFYNIEGRQFFEIVGTGCVYDKDLLDGCFIFKNKIVCYFSVNKGFADSLICNTNKMQCMDMLSKYKEKHENNINDDRHYVPMSYRIISKDSIRVASKSDFVWIKACDTTVIKNKLLNKIINKYP